MSKYEVVDNFLEKDTFNHIKQQMLYGSLPWYYSSNVSGISDDNDYYFSSVIFDHMTGQRNNFLDLLLPIISKIQPTILIRIKANLYPRTEVPVHHLPHRDYNFTHQGAIFYINENNGPTVLEDKTEIHSKENRILFFDPHQLHNSVSCTDQNIRVNINLNYLKYY